MPESQPDLPSGSDAGTWDFYLAAYHRENAGITERVLSTSPDAAVGTAYDWLRAALPARVGLVVDLACGSAPLQPLLSSSSSYVGVDVSEAELECAVALGRYAVVRASATALPLADSSADVVVCSMGIMLFQPVEVALAEVARVLRPGGSFITTRPAGGPVRLRDLSIAATLTRGLHAFPQMPQRFGRGKFRGLLQAAGMTEVDDTSIRFVHALESLADAQLVIDALYLPRVDRSRRAAAVRRLARRAGAGVQIPIYVRRTVAVRNPGHNEA